MPEIHPDLAGKVLAADLRNVVKKVSDGGILTPQEREMIECWLDRCDVVKYGGLRASAPEAQAVLDDARVLVVTTTQLQEAAKHAAKAAA